MAFLSFVLLSDYAALTACFVGGGAILAHLISAFITLNRSARAVLILQGLLVLQAAVTAYFVYTGDGTVIGRVLAFYHIFAIFWIYLAAFAQG